jgi:hypothetical protein
LRLHKKKKNKELQHEIYLKRAELKEAENEFNNLKNNLEQTVDEDMYKLFNGKISDQNTNEAQQQERKINLLRKSNE